MLKNRWSLFYFTSAWWLTITLVMAMHTTATKAQPTSGSPSAYHLPDYGDLTPPEPRALEEVHALLAGSKVSTEEQGPLKLLLVAGPKDHKRGAHDYPAWQEVWSRLLAIGPQTLVATAWEFPTPEQVELAEVIVFYQRGKWDNARAQVIDPFLARGGGLVYIHWAVDGREQSAEFSRRIGLASQGGSIRYRHGPLKIDFSPASNHPIARNFSKINFVDESYWELTGNPNDLTLLGTSTEEGEPRPQFWTVERGRGRVFVSIPGHYMWSFDDPAFRLLLMRGIAWAGNRNVDRFNDLILMDARVKSQ